MMESVRGIEPRSSAWKAVARPLSYTDMWSSARELNPPIRHGKPAHKADLSALHLFRLPIRPNSRGMRCLAHVATTPVVRVGISGAVNKTSTRN